MSIRFKLGFSLVFIVVFLIVIKPVITLAADNFCVLVDMFDTTLIYHTYNLSTGTLSSLTLEENEEEEWKEISPTGQTIVVSLFRPSDSGVSAQILRFINLKTQSSYDVNVTNSALERSGNDQSGWSPNGEFYAIPIISYEDNTTVLTIFSKFGTVADTVEYSSATEASSWAWSPLSDQIALLYSSYADKDYGHAYLTLRSINGELLHIKINGPLDQSHSQIFWSPDSKYLVLRSGPILYVINAGTGKTVTVTQSLYYQPFSAFNVLWTEDSQYILYMTPVDEVLVNLERYSVQASQSTVLRQMSRYSMTYPSNRPGPSFYSSEFSLEFYISHRYILLSQNSGKGLQFILVDIITGEEQEIAPGSFKGPIYEWSPSTDILWLYGGKPITLVRPDTNLLISLPAGQEPSPPYPFSNYVVSWSANEVWTSLITYGLEGHSAWILNTQTGNQRQISVESASTLIDISNNGYVLIMDGTTLSLNLQDSNEKLLITTNLKQLDPELGQIKTALWTPDGQTFAYLKNFPEHDTYTLSVAHRDGTLINEVVISKEEYGAMKLHWVSCD